MNGNAILYYFIHRCVICGKLRGSIRHQKVVDLPVERCTEATLFTYCDVDKFGSLIINEKRSKIKCNSARFTCEASKKR